MAKSMHNIGVNKIEVLSFNTDSEEFKSNGSDF
jgi:hypothetical protein